MIRLLDDDEVQHEHKWYAEVYKFDITFTLWDPVNWKTYEANYYRGNNKIYFSHEATYDNIDNIDTILSMINFIKSDVYKNIDINEDETLTFEI